jgi:hydrogenase maturation protease
MVFLVVQTAHAPFVQRELILFKQPLFHPFPQMTDFPPPFPSTLVIGFGNPDRQDDGVAWHVMVELARNLGRTIPDYSEGFQPDSSNPDFMFILQLTPELAEEVAKYDRVCFMDAHTGNIAEEIALRPLQSGFQASPFTHHLTPETLLSFCQALYQKSPSAVLISIRGYEFGFIQELSPRTRILAGQAAEMALHWLSHYNR